MEASTISKGQVSGPLWSGSNVVKVIGEEVVSWKRRVESFITSQCPFVKINLSIIAITSLTFGGLALAQVDIDQSQASSFDVYRSIRSAEAIVTGSPTAAHNDSALIASTAFDTADDYIKEIFGTPVPSRMTAAEVAVSQPLKAPLPNYIIDNGPPPVPHPNVKIAAISSPLTSRDLLWPMRGGLVTSRFGMRWGRLHEGTDIAAPMGTPVLAAGAGKVIFSGWQEGYGQLIIVDHGNGVKTKYGHCSKLLVNVGEAVHQGDIIAKVGATGHATGPHLHYEVVREGVANNPEFFTRRR